MKCPYCLQEGSIRAQADQTASYRCTNCQTPIPRTFAEAQGQPRITTGVVGFSAHGKTVYLSALFSALGKLTHVWPSFYLRSLDEFTHRVLYEHVPMFDKGILPDSTPANFPNPALVHYNNMPVFDDVFVAYYDTAGEIFTDAEHILRTGFYVATADCIMLIISIPDCNEGSLDLAMTRLLDTYLRAVKDRFSQNNLSNQHLVVIFTKADLFMDQLPEKLQTWLKDGTTAWYADALGARLLDINMMSNEIGNWLENDMGCHTFTHMLRDHVKQVHFALVSATGIPSADGSRGEPLRVVDPFLCLVYNQTVRTEADKSTQKPSGSFWKNLFNRKS